MHSAKPAAFCIVLAVLLAGCAAAGHIKQGDASIKENRPAQAVRHYELALNEEPKLSDNGKFTAKLTRARAMVLLEEGQKLIDKGDFDQAVERFNQSVEIDPDFPQALQALRQASQQAADSHYRQALRYADAGDLPASTSELKLAQQYYPHNADVRTALDSLPPERISPVQSTYQQARAMQNEKRWLKAADLFATAINNHPNDILCRVELYRSEQTLKHAIDLRSEGLRLAQEKRLDNAISTFAQAAEVWPFIDGVQAPLAEARAQRNQAQQYHTEAATFLSQSEWLKAIAQARAALDIFPFHGDAIAVLEKANHEMARIHTAAGQAFLTEQNPVRAEAAFLQALTFVPDAADAHQGLARIYYDRGLAAQENQLWGNALLWFADAVGHYQQQDYQLHLAAMRDKVTHRISYDLAVQVSDAGGILSPDSSSLESKLLYLMSNQKPAYLSLVTLQEGSPAPSYHASLTLANFDVYSQIVRTEHRIHRYTIYQEVPNPELPGVRHNLASAALELQHLRRQANQPCSHCSGKGKINCPDCKGKGHTVCKTCKGSGKSATQPCPACSGKAHTICQDCKGKGKLPAQTCPQCSGTGKVLCRHRNAPTNPKAQSCPDCSGTRKRTCTHCKGKGKSAPQTCPSCSGKGRHSCKACNASGKLHRQNCPSCNGKGQRPCSKCDHSGKITCPHCKGSGKSNRVSRSQINRQEQRVRSLQRELDRLPVTVTQELPAEWRYVVAHHEKRGQIEAGMQIINPVGGEVLYADSVRKTAVHRDTTIDNASPDIGLKADHLNLPSNQTVWQSLLDQAAAEASAKVLAAVTQQRIAEARARIAQLKRQGASENEITEAEVDLAHLLAPLDSQQAVGLINTLRQGLLLAAR